MCKVEHILGVSETISYFSNRFNEIITNQAQMGL